MIVREQSAVLSHKIMQTGYMYMVDQLLHTNR